MLPLLGIVLALHPARADRYLVTNSKGKVRFHMVASLHEINGEAESFSGALNIGPDAPHTGQVDFPAAGLTTFLGVRDKRMRSYVLQANKFPNISYRISGMGGDVAGLDSGEGSGRVTLNGELTVAGVTRSLDIPSAYTWDGDELKLVGKVTTKWTDFKLPDPSILISTLYPGIDLKYSVTATKAP